MLQSLSSVSSAHSRQDEVLPHGEPQSSNDPPVASPPEARQDENIDTPTLSQGVLMLRRWIPTRMKKSNKGPALHEPDRVPRHSHEPAEHQSRPQLPARVEDSNTAGPSTMAATRRVPVSVFFLDRQSDAVCLTYHSSERWRNPFYRERFVFHQVHMQALIIRCSQSPSAPVRKKVLLIADKLLQVQQNQVVYVFSDDCRPHRDSLRPIRYNKRTIHPIPHPGGSV